jgi:hypothetical protein
MKNTLIVPVLLLATTPFVVSCTQKTTDLPSPPPVTGTTETVAPVVTGTVAPVVPVQPTTVNTGSVPVTTVAPVTPEVFTRTEIVSYKTPAGTDPVEFSVTVTDGVITAASATPKADNEISKKLQTAFAAEVSTKVVGKKAADLDIDAIGGASLTSF